MNCDIFHNAALDRFETTVQGNLSVIDYRREGSVVYLTHVGVPRPIGNRGIAAELTRAAFDWARAEGLQVVPVCPYVVAWIKRHRSYRPLLRPS
jgi:predicted GNAT family acetyltransferase